ncbi:MAG TPA: Gfo/Idh/MocA family oxidoreductase [Thermoanaerobaculia bacterium]|nr:Gfo/Idh/MocA family oxidoreductase [Thermoanaerobaculia bacterium]
MPQQDNTPMTRRNLLTLAGQSLVVAGVAGALPRAALAAPQAPARGDAPAPPPKIELPPLSAPTEQKESGPPNPLPPDQRVGYAIVGLGHLALDEVLPAFVQCKRSRVTALVSGHPEKAAAVARQYGIDPRNLYNYQNYDELRNNSAVQVVYVILPNSMHAEYTIRGAKAGKHVLCEKPMATSSRDCQQMIDASKAAGRRLMIGYRMQYEPYNREIIRRARARELGDLRLFTADNGQNQGDPSQWRLKRALAGGGPLMDLGIYCLNAARYVSGEEPVEVFARTWTTPGDPRFKEVEESMVFELRFPSGLLASCTCSYGTHRRQQYTVAGALGWAELNPSFPYRGQHLRVARADSKREEVTEVRLDQPNQFAREIDHLSQCVTENRTPHTPGEEGLADLRIMEQLYASAQAGHSIALPPSSGLDVTRGPAPQEEG